MPYTVLRADFARIFYTFPPIWKKKMVQLKHKTIYSETADCEILGKKIGELNTILYVRNVNKFLSVFSHIYCYSCFIIIIIITI
jgi:hypothetical protein